VTRKTSKPNEKGSIWLFEVSFRHKKFENLVSEKVVRTDSGGNDWTQIGRTITGKFLSQQAEGKSYVQVKEMRKINPTREGSGFFWGAWKFLEAPVPVFEKRVLLTLGLPKKAPKIYRPFKIRAECAYRKADRRFQSGNRIKLSRKLSTSTEEVLVSNLTKLLQEENVHTRKLSVKMVGGKWIRQRNVCSWGIIEGGEE